MLNDRKAWSHRLPSKRNGLQSGTSIVRFCPLHRPFGIEDPPAHVAALRATIPADPSAGPDDDEGHRMIVGEIAFASPVLPNRPRRRACNGSQPAAGVGHI